MRSATSSENLKLSLVRALLGNVFPDLRQASIAADEASLIVSLRFEFDGEPSQASREACSCAATEVIADFEDGWRLEEEYLACSYPSELSPLAHVAFLRAEPQNNA